METKRIALIAVCVAIVAVLISSVPVPIAATGGFTHPGAIAEIFVAMAFGPMVGAIAGGVGGAIADLSLGYGSFAPLTLVAHGLLGYLAGMIGFRKDIKSMVIGWVVGGLALVAVYFLGGATIYGFGFGPAASEIPFNLFQVALGGLGIVLYKAVKSAYPKLESLAGDVSFKER